MAAVVDKEKCISCGACTGECPVSAITLNDFAEVDPDTCIGCGACAGVCPNEAISLD